MDGQKELVVIGGSGHAKVVCSVAESAGYHVIGFADEHAKTTTHFGKPIGPLAQFSSDAMLAVGIGNPRVRARIYRELSAQGRIFPALIHRTAWVEPSSSVGPCSLICAGAVVAVDVKIGAGCIVNTGATVDHDCIMHDFSHCCPGVHLAGNVTLGEGVWVGVGSSAVQQISLGEWAYIGGGASITKSLPANCVAVGVPAKVIRTEPYFKA